MQSRHHSRLIFLLREQKGMAAIWMAMLGAILVGITAFAVDIGYALVTQNELQNAADAAVLASTRQMGVTYLAMPLADQQDLGRDLPVPNRHKLLLKPRLRPLPTKPRMWPILPSAKETFHLEPGISQPIRLRQR